MKSFYMINSASRYIHQILPPVPLEEVSTLRKIAADKGLIVLDSVGKQTKHVDIISSPEPKAQR